MILDVQERPHSPLSPSSFERISACTKSYQLAAAMPPAQRRVAGPDALLGTAAHAVLEHGLRGGRLEEIDAVLVDGQRVDVDAAMREAVDVALAWIREHLAGRELLIERQVVAAVAQGLPAGSTARPPGRPGSPWTTNTATRRSTPTRRSSGSTSSP